MTSGRTATSRSSDDFMRLVVLLGTVLSLIMLTTAVVLKVYLGIPVESILSFPANDTPVLPAGVEPFRLGSHTFGDYALMHWLTKQPNLGFSEFFLSPWPPATYLFFSPFSFLPYPLGLFLMLSLIALSCMMPILHALSRSAWSELERLVALCGLVIFSGPFISAIDRGNVVGLLPALLYLYVTALKKGSDWSAVLLLVLAIVIKPHASLFLLIAIVFRCWKVVIRTSLLVLIVQVYGLLGSGLPLFEAVSRLIAAQVSISYDLPAEMSVSSLSFLQWLIGDRAFIIFDYSRLWVLLGICVVSMLAYRLSKSHPASMLILTFCTFAHILPASPIYNSVVVFALFGLFLGNSLDVNTRVGKQLSAMKLSQSECALGGTLLLVEVIPIPISFLGTGSIQRPIAGFAYLIFVGFCVLLSLSPIRLSLTKWVCSALAASLISVTGGLLHLQKENTVLDFSARAPQTIPTIVSEALCSPNILSSRSARIVLKVPLDKAGRLSRIVFGTGKSDDALLIRTFPQQIQIRVPLLDDFERRVNIIRFEDLSESGTNKVEIRIRNGQEMKIEINETLVYSTQFNFTCDEAYLRFDSNGGSVASASLVLEIMESESTFGKLVQVTGMLTLLATLMLLVVTTLDLKRKSRGNKTEVPAL